MDVELYYRVAFLWKQFEEERKEALSKAENHEAYGGIMARYELIWEKRCNELFGGKQDANADADG